jgi:hypothetical protein
MEPEYAARQEKQKTELGQSLGEAERMSAAVRKDPGPPPDPPDGEHDPAHLPALIDRVASDLAFEIWACRDAVEMCLRGGWSPSSQLDYMTRRGMTSCGIELMHASAELAAALAKLKGEVRQHIAVERLSSERIIPLEPGEAPVPVTARRRGPRRASAWPRGEGGEK